MNILILGTWLCSLALAQVPDDYAIGPGDVIDIKVHGHDLGRSQFIVGASGEISFPYVGKIELRGQTVFQAESLVEEKLADGYLLSPEVTIQVAEHRSQRVEVLGAVDKAGIYYLDGPTTVRSLIAKAGGINVEKGGVVLLTRNGQVTRIGLADLEGPEGAEIVEPGDVVNVDPAGSVVYLAGEVKKPGAIQYSEGLTVSQALIRAGGSSGVSRLSGTYILRDGERISINLRRVLKGKDADMMLEPGDKVVVPESAL